MLIKKNKVYKSLLLMSVMLLFSGCSTVKFYNTERGNDKTNKTRLKVYYPKPFLLVSEIVDEKQKKISTAKIIYLPDYSDFVYVDQVNYGGSSKLSINLAENGTLRSIASEYDSKVAETITSVADIFGAIGGIIGDQKKAMCPSTEYLKAGLYEIKYKDDRYSLMYVGETND